MHERIQEVKETGGKIQYSSRRAMSCCTVSSLSAVRTVLYIMTNRDFASHGIVCFSPPMVAQDMCGGRKHGRARSKNRIVAVRGWRVSTFSSS